MLCYVAIVYGYVCNDKTILSVYVVNETSVDKKKGPPSFASIKTKPRR